MHNELFSLTHSEVLARCDGYNLRCVFDFVCCEVAYITFTMFLLANTLLIHNNEEL